MGTPVAVCFSIIYLDMLENDILEKCHSDTNFVAPIIIKRYIDDIASVFNNNDRYSATLFINTYNEIRPNHIQITYQISEQSGIFLDVEFYKGNRINLGKFETKVYQKPNNQYLYIPPMSYHNPPIFTAFIKAEIKRYKMLCSNDLEFLEIKSLFYQRLIARGYKPDDLDIIFVSSDHISRHEMLSQYKYNQINKTNNKRNDNAFQRLVITISISIRARSIMLGKLLSNTINDTAHDSNYHAIFGYDPPRVITCYERAQNLGDILRSSIYSYPVTQFPM